jgi:hypothetical protein
LGDKESSHSDSFSDTSCSAALLLDSARKKKGLLKPFYGIKLGVRRQSVQSQCV